MEPYGTIDASNVLDKLEEDYANIINDFINRVQARKLSPQEACLFLAMIIAEIFVDTNPDGMKGWKKIDDIMSYVKGFAEFRLNPCKCPECGNENNNN